MNLSSQIAKFLHKTLGNTTKGKFQDESQKKSALKYLFAFLLFATLGYLGNYFRLPLFFGVDFLFGSIFVLIATYFYGITLGGMVAAIASIHTYFLWGQPYDAVLLILEALWVGIWLNHYQKTKKGSHNLVLLVLSYWLCLGAPLCFGFYHFILGFGNSSLSLVILKQLINGVFNALIASLCVDYFPPLRQYFQRQRGQKRKGDQYSANIQQMLFHSLLAFVFIPILMIAVLISYQSLQDIDTRIDTKLHASTQTITVSLKYWHQRNLGALQELAAIGTDSQNLERLQFATTTIGKITPSFLKIYIADAEGNVLSTFFSITNTDKTSFNQFVGRTKIFQQVRTTLSTAFGDIHTDAIATSPHIDVAVPILKNNRFNGIVIAEIDISQIREFLIDRSKVLKVDILLLDRYKSIISSTSPEFLSGKTFDIQQGGELRPFKADNQMQWFPKIKGASLMTRWRKSYYLKQVAIGGESPWGIVVRFSPSEYISTLENLQIYILALILAIILPATIVANVLSRRLVKPIAKLIRSTTDIQQDLSAQSNFAWQSSNLAEIDALGDNFQVMAIALREQFHEIEQTNQNLEIRIQERTAELIKSEERWQLAIQAADDGIWDWNIETGVIFRSERWRTMLGLNPEIDNEQPVDWLDLIHPEDRDRILQLQEDYFTKKIPQYVAEYRMRCQDGSYKWILTQAMAIWNDEGKAIRLVGANNDITDRELAKMEILQAMEVAQSANRAKSEFLATMSHEIRTPMNAVIGFTSLLLDTNIDAEQREFMEIIRLSGDNLLTIINDILDFSKIESGQFRLDAHPFNLRHCIEESLDLLASVAATKRIELAYCIDPEVPEWIVSDITRLRQILVNLFSNAVKFTSQGAVTVRVSVQQFDDRNQNYQLLFSVKDTGIGIPVDRYDRLFKPFSQVDSSTTRQYGGTGLGLAIANHLTLLMGGNMSVESVVGIGSTFSFTISTIAEIANQTYLVREEWNQSLIGKRILILEDNDVSQESITTFTQILKMEVMATSSSEQAIAWLQSEKKFDLAIVDASIPITMLEGNVSSDKPDNYDIRHLIRIQSSLLPMILLSHTSNCDLFTSDPITICLSKPIKRSQLYKSILKLCSDQSLVKSQSKQKDNNLFDEKFASKCPLRILLAEDNIINQKVATLFLNRLGYRVDVVANGIEVLESICRQNYDVILMDVHMPEMDGLTASRRIIAEFTKQKPWIIALTADALEGDRKICLEAGMQDYVSKPIQVQELIQALEQAFNNRHQ